ncbi:four-carbon acid sugar kinase family protein, partial [Streptomyces sp. A7024]|nr:four-carbon acid sugar kinase family protein [Streptomyces coryli]
MASAATAPPRTAGVLALADDLSGAAEVAVALRRAVRVELAGGGRVAASVTSASPSPSTVIDLDSRSLSPAEAADRVRAALSAYNGAAGQVRYKKVDSQLRGNLAAEAAAYAEGADGLLIAPALPAAGRTVRDGVVHLQGVPLQHTDGWRAEGRPAPASIAEALSGLPTRLIGLDVVRDGPDALVGGLAAALTGGRHVIADAETDADLDALARAALVVGPRLRLLGAGGLASALGRALPDAAAPGGRAASGAHAALGAQAADGDGDGAGAG